MVNNHPTQTVEPKAIVNHKSQINMRVVYRSCYILQPDWSLSLLVNTQDCKQGTRQLIGNIILQLPVMYETESTTSCPVSMENIAHLLVETRVKWRIYMHVEIPCRN